MATMSLTEIERGKGTASPGFSVIMIRKGNCHDFSKEFSRFLGCWDSTVLTGLIERH